MEVVMITFQELEANVQQTIALIKADGGSKENQAALLHTAETQFAVAKNALHVEIAKHAESLNVEVE